MNRRTLFGSLLAMARGLFGKKHESSKPVVLVLRDGWPFMLVNQPKNATIETILEYPREWAVVTSERGLTEVELDRYPLKGRTGFSVVRFRATDTYMHGHRIYREEWRSERTA